MRSGPEGQRRREAGIGLASPPAEDGGAKITLEQRDEIQNRFDLVGS